MARLGRARLTQWRAYPVTRASTTAQLNTCLIYVRARVDRVLIHLFPLGKEREREVRYDLEVTLLEIYNEKIQDLLGDGKSNATLRAVRGEQGMTVQGLTYVCAPCAVFVLSPCFSPVLMLLNASVERVTSYEQLVAMMKQGMTYRATASTDI